MYSFDVQAAGKCHRSPWVRITSGNWPMVITENASSLVWVINESACSDASSWNFKQTCPCLLQPLTNEFSCHLEKKRKKTSVTQVPSKNTFNEIQSSEALVVCFVFYVLLQLCVNLPNCYWFFPVESQGATAFLYCSSNIAVPIKDDSPILQYIFGRYSYLFLPVRSLYHRLRSHCRPQRWIPI